jgi:hypothetical protein
LVVVESKFSDQFGQSPALAKPNNKSKASENHTWQVLAIEYEEMLKVMCSPRPKGSDQTQQGLEGFMVAGAAASQGILLDDIQSRLKLVFS